MYMGAFLVMAGAKNGPLLIRVKVPKVRSSASPTKSLRISAPDVYSTKPPTRAGIIGNHAKVK